MIIQRLPIEPEAQKFIPYMLQITVETLDDERALQLITAYNITIPECLAEHNILPSDRGVTRYFVERMLSQIHASLPSEKGRS